MWRVTLGRNLESHDAAEPVGGMCYSNGCSKRPPSSTLYRVQREYGAPSPTTECSTRYWSDFSAKGDSKLLL